MAAILRVRKPDGTYADVPSLVGSPGKPGVDGYSPTVSLKQKDDGVEITVQNKDGTQTANVLNGQNGNDGIPGATGATPRFTVTAVTGEAGTAASVTQSGTAENPTLEFTIPRGTKGDPGEDAPQEAVLFTEQTLSDAQKAQARGNIGAADAATVSSLNADVDTKINKSDALTLEEIEASTDLTSKVASAESAKDINKVVSTMGAISLGFIPSGQSAKFRVDEVFFILFAPNSTTSCMDSYGTTASGFARFVRSLTTSTEEYYTLTKETDGTFTLVNNVPWSTSYLVLGTNGKLILE